MKASQRALCAAACLLALGCTKAPAQHFDLESLKVSGNTELDDDEIEERIASRETPRFLGMFPGVIYDYEVFNRFVLERDLQRVERLYRSRGYYQAHARAAHVFRSGSKVRVEIVVEEGEPVLLRRVDIHGLERLPAEVRAEALQGVTDGLPLDAPFEEEKFEDSGKALARVLADHGYAQATVRKSADVNLPKNVASAGFWVQAGEASELGEIQIQGLGDLPEDKVRRALDLEPGSPYSQSELDEAKRALLDLGVFSSVELQAQVEKAGRGPTGRPRVPILVRVQRSKLRSVHLGGGVLLDTIKSDFHLTLGWEDQSFLGGMRKMLVEAKPGAVVYPTHLPTFEAPERLLPQGRLRTEFRQPGFFEARTNALVKGQLNVYPVLLSSKRDEGAPILGYRDYRVSVGAERSLYKLYGYLSQNLQINVPFAYLGTKSPALERVIVSYPALLTTLDFRNDPIHPRKGFFLSNEVQVAGVGGEARDVKLQPEARVYVPVTRRVTVAARGAIGLLFPDNYGDTVEPNALTGTPGRSAAAGDAAGQATIERDWVRDIQLMFFRGFFAGGAGSNRGYGPREIGPHGVLPFLIPGQGTDEESCEDSAGCDLPLGGFTLWEASLELRYPLVDALSGTLFTDAADVSARKVSFRWRPHLSVGSGLRYDTPVGPIRFDLGYRIPGAQAPADAADEGTPETIFGLPLAISFGIGESF